MTPAVEAELASPFITAQKDAHISNTPQPCNVSPLGQASQDQAYKYQPADSTSEFGAVFHHHDDRIGGTGVPYGSPSKLWGMASRLWGNKSFIAHGSVVESNPCPVRVMPLSSGWFESDSLSCPSPKADEGNQDQGQDHHQQQKVVVDQLWDGHKQIQQVQQNPLAYLGLQQQEASRGVGSKHGSKLHKLLSSLKHSRRHHGNADGAAVPVSKRSPQPGAYTADTYQQQVVQQQQWGSYSPASAAVPLGSHPSPDTSSSWWPHGSQQLSAFGTSVGAAAAAASVASGSLSSGYGSSPAKSSLTASPCRFDGNAAATAASTPSRCGMLLGELPSLGEVTEDFSDTNPSAAALAAAAAAAAAAVPVAAGSPVKGGAAVRSISFNAVSHKPRQGPRDHLSRRCQSTIAAATGRRPRNSLDRTNSLRAALVTLEHASTHAGRFLDKMSQGLARVTSMSVRSGVLKQPAGREVLKDWELGPELGRGATCVTRLAFARRNGTTAACKSIHKSSIFRSAAVKAAILGVQRELAIMQHTSGHPNVVQLRGVYEDGRQLHLVMEWCGGGALSQLAARVPGGRCGEVAAAAVAKAVLEVLALCHGKGVVHRDIKLDNLLLSQPIDDPQQITSDMVKVTDFGISVPFTPGQMLSELAGTPEYMAPEVLQRRYCQQADIWSTGVVLFELISGQMPYTGHTPEQLLRSIQQTDLNLSGPGWEGVSDDAKSIVAMMLTRDQATRPSAQQLLLTFRDWLQLGVAQ